MVLLDGDGQHNPAAIPELLAPILEGQADIVIGTRERSSSRIPVHRRFGQRILDVFTAVGSMAAVTDSQSGFRALSRAAIESLILDEKAFGIESEMLIEAKEQQLRIAEVPIRARYDVDGSTKGPFSHGLGVVDRLLRIIAVRHPLLFFTGPGVALFLFGLWAGLDTMAFYNNGHAFLIGKALLAIIFLMVGALAIFAGVILNVMPKTIVRSLMSRGLTGTNG